MNHPIVVEMHNLVASQVPSNSIFRRNYGNDAANSRYLFSNDTSVWKHMVKNPRKAWQWSVWCRLQSTRPGNFQLLRVKINSLSQCFGSSKRGPRGRDAETNLSPKYNCHTGDRAS